MEVDEQGSTFTFYGAIHDGLLPHMGAPLKYAEIRALRVWGGQVVDVG
ncbi:MAG: hypothetical protein QW176_00050 [Candidatus Bathyarchaeia archaeon]